MILLGRNKLINKFFKRIKRDIDNYTSDKIKEETLDYSLKNIFTDLQKLRLPENEFSRLGFFMFEKFDHFFARRFGNKVRHLLMNKYESYKIEFGLAVKV